MGAPPPMGSSPTPGPIGGLPGPSACAAGIKRNNEIISTVVIDIIFFICLYILRFN
jgi:hypothetical protein